MSAGRKPLAALDLAAIEVPEPSLDGALSVMRETAISTQQEQAAGVFSLGQNVGAALMANMIKNFSAAAEIRAFEEINKSKSFKHLQIRTPDGVLRAAENIDEFCRIVFGRGYKAMNNHKVMLQQLGEDAYENAQRLGLNRAQLRLMLTLPEDERTAVEEAMQAGGKDEVVTLIQSLANKLDETRGHVEALKGELKATEEISAEKTQCIETLRRETKRIAAAPRDQVLAELQAESTRIANDVRGGIIGQLRQALLALDQHGDTPDARPVVFMAGLVEQLRIDLVALRDELDLPQIDPDEHGWIGQPD